MGLESAIGPVSVFAEAPRITTRPVLSGEINIDLVPEMTPSRIRASPGLIVLKVFRSRAFESSQG